jgi:hypothetical protein
MRAWLESNEIAALTDAGDWPSPATAPLWKRFRDETLSGGTQKWRVSETRRVLAAGQPRPNNGIYRVETDGNDVWICTPDWRRIAKLRSGMGDRAGGLFSALFTEGDNRALVRRFGIGRAEWLREDA